MSIAELSPNYSTSISPDGRYEYVEFNSEKTDLVDVAQRIHVDCYQRMGFVKPQGVVNGRFAPGIDKANGANVDYSVGFLRGTTLGEQRSNRGSIRKINIPNEGSIEDLPSYSICEGNLSNEGRDILGTIVDPEVNLKEIAALSGDDGMSVFYMLKEAIRNGLPRKEKWFFGIVSDTFDSLTSNFGPNAIYQIGDPTPIPDSRVSDRIRLIPAYVDTETFIDSMRVNLLAAKDMKQRIKIGRSFFLCIDGLDPTLLSEETRAFAQNTPRMNGRLTDNVKGMNLWPTTK